MLRPLFLRTIKNKTGADVLKLFEQFRKNIKLNKTNELLPNAEKGKTLKDIKLGIYDGLVADLMGARAYQLC